MDEQQKNTLEEQKEIIIKGLTDFFSALSEKTREVAKAFQTYPNRRVVNKALHGRSEKIRKKNIKKILDWYRKQNL